MKVKEMINAISSGDFDKNLKAVYVTDSAVELQKPRYVETLNTFGELFGWDRDVSIMSAPGRTEVCGNHTDHNNGKVLAASINLDAIAVVSKNDDNIIRVKSKGHRMNVVDVNDLVPDEKKFGDSTALVQGVAAGIKDLGFVNYAKPDTHTKDVIEAMGYLNDDVSVIKAIQNIANENNDTAFNVDRMIWLICSGYFYNENIRIGSHKKELIQRIHNYW